MCVKLYSNSTDTHAYTTPNGQHPNLKLGPCTLRSVSTLGSWEHRLPCMLVSQTPQKKRSFKDQSMISLSGLKEIPQE